MKQFLTLFKLNFRYYTLPDFSDKKSRKRYIALVLLLGLCFLIPIIGLFATLYATAQLAFAEGGTVEMLSGIFCISQITVLFLSAFSYISSMFFAKDNEIMLNLPVPQVTVFMSKLLVCYVNELLISTVVVLPATVITAIAAAQAGFALGAEFYILIPVAVLLLPLLPMLLLSIVSFPIAVIIQKLSKRPILGAIVQAVFTIAFVAAVYYLSYSSSYSVGNGQTLSVSQIFAPMAKVNVFTTMLAKAMFGQNVAGNFFAFLGSTAAFAAVSCGLSVLFYKRALQSGAEGSGSSKKRAVKEEREKGVRTPFTSFIFTDVKYLFRESSVTVNTILSLVMPALLVFLCTFMTTRSMEASMQAAQEAGAESGAAEGGFMSAPYLSLALSIMMAGWFCSGTNLFSTVGFSLERENFSVIKTLPVSFDKIYYAKLIAADAVTLVSTVLASVVTVVISKVSVWDFIFMAILMSVYGFTINAFALLRDLKAPRLNWITVKELKKNNFHTLIPMLVAIVGIIPVMIVAFVCAFSQSLSNLARSAIIWGVFAAVDLVYVLLFHLRAGDKALKYFEECEC